MTLLIPIPAAELPEMIGKGIHLSWANKGCIWILDRIEGDTLHMHTPRSKKRFVGKAADARYVRQYEPANTERVAYDAP